MHNFEDASELVNTAATLAGRGLSLVHSVPSTIGPRCEEYWLACHERCQSWGAQLRQHEAPYTLQDENAALEQWLELHGLLEEILSAGILNRVWTAIAGAIDPAHEISAYIQSAYLGQLDAHRRALKLILKDSLSLWQAEQLDKLRRRSERWTDLLLAHVAHTCNVNELAYDMSRVIDFAETLSKDSPDQLASQLLIESVRQPLGKNLRVACPNPQLNQRIAESILACLGPDVCDSCGSTGYLWELRLHNMVDDAMRMVQRLSHESEGIPLDVDV
jgi:hypothetical protein